MLDFRPIGYVIGLIVAALGASMIVPLATDYAYGNDHWPVFLEAGVVTGVSGGLLALASANAVTARLSLQQTFLLATAVWVVLPLFGAIPFVLGATGARPVDAIFEAMSGFTTTGATVFSGLDQLPPGLLLWRSMLQWFGGVGIIVVAMVFLPELRIGGMQIFRAEAFETMGKVLPRAVGIARQISVVYIGLTVLCVLGYLAVGMSGFDAINHALTSLSTGGFSTRDASFGAFQGPAEYVAAVFMILAALPFVRFVQLVAGTTRPLLIDKQIRAFLLVLGVGTLSMATFRVYANDDNLEHAFREGLFNVASILTGTGYASVDYQLWGAFPVVFFFFLGLIGGCAGSTSCSVKIFRYQILFSAIRAQIRRLHSPSGIFMPRFEGQPVTPDVISSVMSFFVIFVVSIGVGAVALGMTGLDFVTALSGSATAFANIGPGLGPVIGPAGNFATLNDTAKWILTFAMLAGRLELLVVYMLFTIRFWRA
jgi:trk system potassium uptake protein